LLGKGIVKKFFSCHVIRKRRWSKVLAVIWQSRILTLQIYVLVNRCERVYEMIVYFKLKPFKLSACLKIISAD
jgi:hypothetical protein